jgi:LysM repeat protein
VPVAPGTGKHRGGAAPEETVNADKVGETGRHASPGISPSTSPTDVPSDRAMPGGDANNTDLTDGTGSEGSGDVTDSKDTSDAYTVKPGDSLTEIAQKNELPGGWGALYDANRSTVGADPDLILPGQSLELTIGLPGSKG